MFKRRTRWIIAGIAVAAELLSYVAWRFWVGRRRSRIAQPG